jgi:hypothetical protein
VAEGFQVHDFGETFFLRHGGGHGGFLVLQEADLFLNGVFGSEAIRDHVGGLTDAVGAINRLGFDRGSYRTT